jgi:hypothetical protein
MRAKGTLVVRRLANEPINASGVIIHAAGYWSPNEFMMESLGLTANGADYLPAAQNEILAYYPHLTPKEVDKFAPQTSPMWGDPDKQEEGA